MVRSAIQLVLAPVIALLAVLIMVLLEPVRLCVVHLRPWYRSPRLDRIPPHSTARLATSPPRSPAD